MRARTSPSPSRRRRRARNLARGWTIECSIRTRNFNTSFSRHSGFDDPLATSRGIQAEPGGASSREPSATRTRPRISEQRLNPSQTMNTTAQACTSRNNDRESNPTLPRWCLAHASLSPDGCGSDAVTRIQLDHETITDTQTASRFVGSNQQHTTNSPVWGQRA